MRRYLVWSALVLLCVAAVGCPSGHQAMDGGVDGAVDGDGGAVDGDGDSVDGDGGAVDGDGGGVDGDGGDVDGDGGAVDGDGGAGDGDGGVGDGDGGEDDGDGGEVDGDGGESDGSDGGDPGADQDPQVNLGAVHLSGDFNDWAAAEPGFAFAPVADHVWRLEVPMTEGLHRFKLTTDGSWTVSFGGQAVAHDRAAIVLTQDGDDVDLVCFYEGTYSFSFHEESLLLEVDLPARPAGGPVALDAEPRGMDNRHLGAALIDALLSDAAIPPAVLSELIASGGTPIRGGQLLHFLVQGADGAALPVYLAGTLNDWDAAALPLEPLAGSRLHYLALPPPAAHLAYKFVQSGIWSSDPLSPNVEWDGIPVAGLGTFNSTLPLPAADRAAGRLLLLAAHPSTTMGDQRDLFIYLPRAYDENPTVDRPIMVVHDGNESIARSQFDAVADAEIAAGRVEPLVMAFVALPSQEQRIDEYTFNTATSRGELYRTYICDELLPFLRASFRVDPDPGRSAVFGASLGGLISYFIGWERPDAFGLVAGMSSSFFWDNNWMIQAVQNDSGPLRPLRFYLDSADVNDNHDETVLMRDALQARGYPLLYLVQAGASHDWFYWKQRFDGMLQFLFPAGP